MNLKKVVLALVAAVTVTGGLFAQEKIFIYRDIKKMKEEFKKDGKKFEEVIQSAQKGNVESQLKLGLINFIEDNQEANIASYTWFRRAAKQGNLTALYWVAFCHDCGKGVKQDIKEAMKLYEEAAKKGCTQAMMELGHIYFNGRAGKTDFDKAFKLFREAADKGNTSGMQMVGLCYKIGAGVKQEEKEYQKWLMKAVERKDDTAMFLLGELHIGNNKKEEAFQWYKKSAELGNEFAAYELSRCYYRGIGVKKDEKTGIKWLMKAAEYDIPEALFMIGINYFDGIDLKKDEVKGEEYIKRAADLGLVNAIVELGNIYADKNKLNECVALYQKAVELGSAEAMHNLSGHYFLGMGVKSDYEKGMKLLLKSAELGYEPAVKKLQEMEKLMKEQENKKK